MSHLAASLGPSAYWYLARATGAVALVLLTFSVLLGILGSLRVSAAPRWPRFALDTVHRDCSLLALALIVVHVVTSVLDGFAPITLIDGIVPFLSGYRPLWLGLGTLSFDLLLAVAITSMVRRRLGYAAWRAVHWLAYASWPVAVLHGLGTGTDVKSWWLAALTIGCVAAVVAAVLIRVARGAPVGGAVRSWGTAAALLTPVGLAVFTLVGPLAPGWARRAGTPASLLGHSARVAPVVARAPASGPLAHTFSASLAGSVSQRAEPGGAIVQLLMRVSGGIRGELRVRMGGTPIQGGGLSLTGSQVDLSADGDPYALQGRILTLEGNRFDAQVSDASGRRIDLHATVSIDQGNDTASGTLSGSPA